MKEPQNSIITGVLLVYKRQKLSTMKSSFLQSVVPPPAFPGQARQQTLHVHHRQDASVNLPDMVITWVSINSGEHWQKHPYIQSKK